MTIIRAQVILNKKSGLPRDAVTNTWHFDVGGAVTPTDTTNIGDEVVNFYTDIAQYLGSSISGAANAHQIKMYNLGEWDAPGEDQGDLAGPPIVVRNFGITPASNGHPSEVAAALTFECGSTSVSEEVGSTRPASRRRGRIYIGPLALTGTVSFDGTTNEAYVSNSFRDAVLAAAQDLQSDLASYTAPIAHCVISKADGLSRKVTHYSMNNDFDTMRSRGVKATSRVRVAAVAVALGA